MGDTVSHSTCVVCGSDQLYKVIETKDYSISGEDFDIYECEYCSHRFTQSVPSEQRIGRYYESDDYISHSDTRKGMVNRLYHLAREYMLGQKRKLIDTHAEGRRLLDIGSGTGYFLQHLNEHKYDVMGVEVDEGARTFARDSFGLDIREPSELEKGQLEGPFHAVSMWHVLEHVFDPNLYLQRIEELLTDDGRLFIAVPNYTSRDAAHYGAEWAAYDVPRHLWHFSPQSMELLAGNNNFELITKKRLPLDPFYVAMLSEKYRKRGMLSLPLGAWNGLRSHLNSLRHLDQSSSLVYIFKKA